VAVLLATVLPLVVFADVPQRINYQGYLTDSAGNPVDGNVNVTFSIYDVATGGIVLWSENQSVQVINGLLRTQLGKNTSLPSNLFDSANRYLEIKVGAETLSPRQQLISVPFGIKAAKADNADTLDGWHGTDLESMYVNVSGDSMWGPLSVERHNLGPGWTEAINGTLYSEDTGAGVYGLAYGPNADGVHGSAAGENGKGVYGEVSGTSGVAIRGYAVGSNGIGGYFTATQGAGLIVDQGNVGIGTKNPSGKLTIVDPESYWGMLRLENSTTGNNEATMSFKGGSDATPWLAGVGPWACPNEFVVGYLGPMLVITPTGNVGIGTTTPSGKLDVKGKIQTEVLQITGGSDIAEPFDIEETRLIDSGMVLVIDPENPGKLKISERAYDRCVAGIISGAGGIKPGVLMSQSETLIDGKYPVALSGRVYCWADASYGAIKPGDLLTTSDTPGQAMKVTDYTRAQGAVIGKAMTALEAGRGLVLVLVTLQ